MSDYVFGDLPTLPFDTSSAVGIAPAMLDLQEQGPISRVRTPSGDEGWLVTRYDEVRKLLADRRLGLSNPNPNKPSPSAARSYMVALMAGDDHATEASRHATMRELLVPLFLVTGDLPARPRLSRPWRFAR